MSAKLGGKTSRLTPERATFKRAAIGVADAAGNGLLGAVSNWGLLRNRIDPLRLVHVRTRLQQLGEHCVMVGFLCFVDARYAAESAAEILQRRTRVPPRIVHSKPSIVGHESPVSLGVAGLGLVTAGLASSAA